MGGQEAGASNFPVITEDAFSSPLPEISVAQMLAAMSVTAAGEF